MFQNQFQAKKNQLNFMNSEDDFEELKGIIARDYYYYFVADSINLRDLKTTKFGVPLLVYLKILIALHAN